MKNIFLKFFKALFVSIRMVFIMTIFRLPWSIWIENMGLLEGIYSKPGTEKHYLKSELKVFSWLHLFLSGIIFLTYPIGIGLIISLFFKGFSWENIFGKLFFLTVLTYFSPVILSFIKESVSLRLLKYFRIESIDEKLGETGENRKEK